MRNRPLQQIVRLNENEYRHLIASAKVSGLSREAYIRKLILGETVKAKPPQELAELLRLLKSTSDNINQIARVSNARSFVRSEELAEIYSKLDDIWGKVKEL